jgi:hypothetical protein
MGSPGPIPTWEEYRMPGMGPAPKDPAKRARRNAPTINTTTLPSEGRKGPAPKWPLPDDPSVAAQLKVARARAAELRDQWMAAESSAAAKKLAKEMERVEVSIATFELVIKQRKSHEAALWKFLWTTPQAVMWEKQFLTRSVALYVQSEILGELGKLDRAKEARMWAAVLGLTPKGMQDLRWVVAEDQVAEQRGSGAATSGRSSARARRGPLTAVPDEPKAAGDD